MAHRQSLPRRILYRILYSAIYFVTLALLLLTPADLIIQALDDRERDRQIYIIWVVAVCSFLTVLILAFVYALRLYGSGSALAAIPKAWVPIAQGDVGERTHKVISAALDRSANIAWRARPRAIPRSLGSEAERSGPGGMGGTGLGIGVEASGTGMGAGGSTGRRNTPGSRSSDEGGIRIVMSADKPVWGDIEHYGWTSPNSTSLPPLLSYETVLSEIPALTEAKALTLAPPDPNAFHPLARSLSDHPPPAALDPAALALLQRPANLSLRDYLSHLASLGAVTLGPTTNVFLSLYEHARFSTRPISNAHFGELMRLFADVLRDMRRLDRSLIMSLGGDEPVSDDDDDDSYDDRDMYNDDPGSHSPSTPRSGDRRFGLDGPPPGVLRTSSANTWSGSWPHFRTAPTTPRDAATPRPTAAAAAAFRAIPWLATPPSRSSSTSLSGLARAGAGQPFVAASLMSRTDTTRSGSSGRSVMTDGSGSRGTGSVIRIALDGEDSGGLPFVITRRHESGSRSSGESRG